MIYPLLKIIVNSAVFKKETILHIAYPSITIVCSDFSDLTDVSRHAEMEHELGRCQGMANSTVFCYIFKYVRMSKQEQDSCC